MILRTTTLLFLTLLFSWSSGQNNQPVFVSAPYSTTCDEDAANESLIIKVNATDKDPPNTPNGTLGYSIKSGNDGRRFVVDAATGNIYLAQKLDYETQTSYSLTLAVTDGGGLSANTILTVTVRNVNDNPPTCTPSVVFGTISENQPPYTQFAQFSCSDPDNLPGQQITYQSYQGSSTTSRSDTIRVGANNGSVYTLRPIDYDKEQDVFTLTVVVSDNGSPPLSTTCLVVLSLKDIDDNPPIFSVNPPIYTGGVNDNATLGDIVLNVTVTDMDQPKTPRSIPKFQSFCVPDYLMVDLHSGAMIVSNTIDGLTYKDITCNVTANSESSTTSTATVIVNINNVINHPPAFQQPFYNTSLTENSKSGHLVIQVSAVDPDQTKVTYNISSGIFSIDSSGFVIVKTPPDYESQTAHLAILTAIDSGNPPSTAQAFLQVIIIPVNEFAPVFTSICNGSIAENATSGTSILQMSAYDNDAGLDGAVSYSIQSSNVLVCMNKYSGVIELAGVLDYETQTVITFVIAATDNSSSTPMTSTQTCTIAVTDVNDQSVQCSQPAVMRMSYPFMTGYSANVVNCTPNTGSLVYSILSGNTDGAFKMYPSDSNIYLDKDPTQQQYSLTIGVSNGGLDTINVTAIFFIELQLNFTNLPSTINVTEGVAAGIIFTVTACCVFPKVEFTMLSGNEDNRVTFTSSNGQVRLMVPYDRETQDVYIYKILAKSDGGQTATSNLTVYVGDINDNAPKFAQDLYERNVDEKLAVSSLIDHFTASDPDFGNNSTLTYTIASGNTGDAFNITSTGSLTLANALSYTTTSRYVLVIRATDGGSPQLTGDTTVIINVEDNNKNPPQFIPMPGVYNTTVSEGTAIGRFVFQLQASNGNSTNITGHFTYAIVSVNTGNAFQVAPANGTLFLIRYLDRETIPSYTLTVSATNENGFSVNGTLIIDIGDTNDNYPVFSPDVIVFTLPDATASGTTVGQIRVTDTDAGANGTVTLTLGSGNTGNAFRLNGNILVTSTTMNYLAVNYYRIQVTGTDGGSPNLASTATIVVIVKHGYIPFFNISSYNLTVPENKMIGSQIIDLNATGLGCPEDGSMDYELISGGGNKFEVRRKTGVAVLVRGLDFETTKVYPIVIIATNKAPNNPETATCTLTIIVTDYNDNQPVFDREGYSFDVPEYSPSGYPVGTVLATDADTGSNGQVYETLTGCSNFTIDPSSGLITVAGVLDYLLKPYYSCFVLATDGGQPQMSAVASVVIRLIDINNHNPYTVGDTSVRFYDSMPAGSDVFKLRTIDLDTGDAGNVSCVIDSPPNLSAFVMDPTKCIIQTTQTLDATVQSVYTMTIREYDAGQPSLENKTTITINVMPSYPNNHDPTYPTNCTKSVTIKRGASVGSFVAGCTPTDLDKGPSGEVESWIVSGNDDGYFIIDVHTANINTATSLLLAKNAYTLIIRSTDKGTPPRNTTITVIIFITPQVTTTITPDYNFTIAENINGLVGVIKVDPGRTVTSYTIQEGNFDNAFDIQRQTNGDGNITVLSIDRERYQIYSLIVDVTTDIGVLTKVVEVTVTDINDNQPVFVAPSTGLQLSIAENTPAGTTVDTVSYTDKDTDAVNRNNTLSVTPPGSTYFRIDQSGNLITTTPLDYETTPSFSFNIQASDAQKMSTSTLPVTINVIDVPEQETVSPSDVTDNAVISLEAPYQAAIGDLVYTLKPGDFSLTPSPKDFVQYVFFQTPAPFSINSNTGDIRVSAQLINHNKYLLWVMIRVINSTTTTTRSTLLRIDTFDMLTQMIVMQFTSTLTYVQSVQRQIQLRTQAYFPATQRVGIFKLVESGNTFRRRLLAQQSAAYTYVVRSTSSDDMTNINDPKDFLTQQEMLSVLQQSPDGTPTPGLSDSSTADISSVSPYEDGSSRNDFEEFINTPAGIAVFCLLGLLLLVILIIIATCIFYRKCYRKNRKPKTKVTDKKSRISRIRDPAQPTNSKSVPNIIISASSPVTHMNQPNDNRSTPPPHDDSFDSITIFSDFSTQTEPPKNRRSMEKKNKIGRDKN